jgi:lipid-A-disaccharide synthase
LNLLVSAGEASGDLHGARLLAALRARRPGVAAFGMGGERLAAAGLDRVARAEDLSVMGISEVFGRLAAVRRALSALTRAAGARRPDAAVLIDFPDFHAHLARRLARRGVPLVYYVSPQVWAWRPGRARVIARRARRILTLFPFETEIYRRLGGNAVCTGHPAVEDVRDGLASDPPAPPKSGERLGLLPGSRESEVRRHWPVLRDAARLLSSGRRLETFAVRAPGLPESRYPGAGEAGIRLVGSGMHPWLASADLAFVSSGTATLETALCGTPMVVLYRASRATFAVARRLVRVPWIALPNLVAGEPVVPELLQEAATAEALAAEGRALLDDPIRRERMKQGLARVAERLGPPGASDRAAEAVLEAVAPDGGSRARAAAAR